MGQVSDKLKNIKMSAEQEIRVPYDENSDNGLLIIGDKYIPEELIIEIFCYYVDHKSLKSCQLVCKRWNNLVQDYIWRKKAEMTIHHSLPIDENAPWTMYYLICDKKPLYRNLLENHSGQEGLKTGWNIIHNEGNGWKVENPPVGVEPLPEEPIFEEVKSSFVTSYSRCWKNQTIDLIKEGASEYLLDQMQPIIKVSEWYSCRWDCPAFYANAVELLNESGDILKSDSFTKELRNLDQNTWFKYEYEFKDYGKGLRKISFSHGGHDKSYWAGHYGSKMAGACIVLELPEVKSDDLIEKEI